ncbi:MAG TPA: hypothetical protein VNZ64_05635 [Candidatus Acidoferrum sp.]|nr:hypothetical protein [Candidatus Acidoferrum sp.]
MPLAYAYDRRGRQTTITQGSATTTDAFDNANDLLSETYSGGTLAGDEPWRPPGVHFRE